MLATNNQGFYTVIDSQLGILAHRVSRQAAIENIRASFEDEPTTQELTALLDSTPEPGAWRTEWAAATAIELHKLDSQQEVDSLKDEIRHLSAEHQSLLEKLEVESRRIEYADTKHALESEFERLVDALATDFGIDYEVAEQQYTALVWEFLKKTPLWEKSMKLYKALAREGLV